MSYEKIIHPKHYNLHPTGVECIDIVETFSFNIGNTIKYLWRAGLKPDSESIEDFKKARFYLDREIGRLTKINNEINQIVNDVLDETIPNSGIASNGKL